MGLLSILKKYAVKLERNNSADFTFPVSKQKEIVNSFKEPKDDIERSYFQYKCQMKLNKPGVSVIMNLCSLPLIIYFILRKGDKLNLEEQCDAVFISEGIPEHVIPDELKNRYDKWVNSNKHGCLLLKEDRKFIKNLFFRYPLSWHLLLKSIMKIQFYRYEIECYKPKAIVVCGEYSFTSSVLTAFCHMAGINHYDVMHGEKYYFMRDSFFHFDACYVWDEYYKDLFISLRAEKTQFIINTPRSMCFSKLLKIDKSVDYTYYLGGETVEALERVADLMRQLKSHGKVVKIRLHPRYSDVDEVRKIFKGLSIEDDKEVDIELSVLRTRNAISGSSTVLNQAYHNGVNVVIDDISDSEKYRKLEELQYIMLKVKHKLLSEILTNGGENEC